MALLRNRHAPGVRDGTFVRRRWIRALGACGILFTASAAALDVVTENFADDPFWSKLNNTAVNDNYGYSPSTNSANGGVGEAGGLFGRHDAFDSFYADTDLGGTLSAKDPLTSSGKISIDTSLSPAFPMNISFFDQTNPSKGGNALRINLETGGRFMLWLRLEIGKNLQSPLQTGLTSGDYTWQMTWNPTGNGGLGSGTVTFFGVSPGTPASRNVTLDIPLRNEPGKPEWLQEPILFNAFGLQNYDGEATTSGQYRVFVDDVIYTVANLPATTSTWKLPGSGSWTVARNWNPGEVPYGDDRTAVFGSGVAQNSTVFVDRDITVKSLQFDNAAFSYAVAGTGTVKLKPDSGTALINVLQGMHEIQINLELQGTTDVSTSAAGALEFDGVVAFGGHSMSIAALSNVRFQNVGDDPTSGILNNAGTLGGVGRVNGSLNNQSGGVVAPGNSVGTLRVDGSFTQTANSTLAIELGGLAAGQFDVLAASGTASLNGILVVSLVNAFTPNIGDSFTVLTAAGGIVDNGLVLGGPNGAAFYLNIVGNNLVLNAGLQGDFNHNGAVDAADYAVWRDTFGSNIDLRADGNGNHTIDDGDYAAWKANFGRTMPSGSSATLPSAVPEPTGIVLVALAALAGAVVRSRRRLAPALSDMCPQREWAFVIAAVFAITSIQVADAELIGNSFNIDPLWQGNDNIVPQGNPSKARDDFNNYGYNANTSNALGSPGEIGGYLGMNTFDSYYADTTLNGNVGGTFPLQQTLHADGKLMVNSDHGPTWNMNIGFFDATDYSSSMVGPQESGDSDAVRFAIIEQSPDYRLRLEIRQQGNGYNGPLLALANGLLDGMYTWSMDYKPTAGVGGKGRLSLEMRGPTVISTFVDVDTTGKNIAMNLNAFGFTNYNSNVSRPDFNKHYTFLDDLTFTTNETADTFQKWAGPDYGSWTAAPSWQSASRTDGAGFIPNGNNRTAIFGSGIDQNALVTVDQTVTVREIEFNNASRSYAIIGTGTVRLDHDSGGDAEINVTAGNHQFQAKVSLATDAVVDALSGARLDFNNSLDLGGHTLTITGPGQVNINNSLVTGPGGMVANLGSLGGTGTIVGNLTSIGTLATKLDPETTVAGLSVDGNAELGGILDVLPSALAGFQPGSTFTVFSAQSITDHGLRLSPEDSRSFRLIVGTTQLVVQAIVPEPATAILAMLSLTLLTRLPTRDKRTDTREMLHRRCEAPT
jgi:hypothetical protein